MRYVDVQQNMEGNKSAPFFPFFPLVESAKHQIAFELYG
jgi:hypothetical protein